ncbi:MAG: hypothetical protein J7J65_07855 [Candidatus Korarchaeota archaeon]|nr:hypothetical protein [Candidatus Korarchaeota archaeon]
MVMVMFSKLWSHTEVLLQSTFTNVNQLWVLVGIIAMFVIGLVIYTCYARSLGIPEGEE